MVKDWPDAKKSRKNKPKISKNYNSFVTSSMTSSLWIIPEMKALNLKFVIWVFDTDTTMWWRSRAIWNILRHKRIVIYWNFRFVFSTFLSIRSIFDHNFTIKMIAEKRRIFWWLKWKNVDFRPKNSRSRHFMWSFILDLVNIYMFAHFKPT